MVLAQIMATIRRWGVFWGVVRPYEGEEYETVYQRVGMWLRRPRVRAGIFAFASVELLALGAWGYFEHGAHVYRIGEELAAAARGQQIVYADLCGEDGQLRPVRVAVLDRPRSVAFRAVFAEMI